MNDMSISREEHLGNQGKLPSTTKCGRSYSINYDFFKEWSADMAYVLGFTATDGCIRVNNDPVYKENGSIKSYKGIYQLTWSVTDRTVLEYILQVMQGTYVIRERPTSYYTKYNYKNVKQQWYVTINSKEIVCDLAFLGIVPNKSKTILLTDNIPTEYIPDYIRGVMDGDGCWSLDIAHKTPHPRAFITSGSKIYLQQIGDLLKMEIGIIPKIYQNERGIYNLSYGGREVAALALYINRGFMIERKREKMLQVISNYQPKVCKKCGHNFIKVAGLENQCYKCHNQKDQDIVCSM